MNYYIADLHFGQNSILKSDGRPFKNTKEMEQTIVRNWNKAVTDDDNIFILGDFCWSRQEDEWVRLLKSLRGHKSLLLGDLDSSLQQSFWDKLDGIFDFVGNYQEITDRDKKVILCYYPLIYYRGDYSESFVMLHGRTHQTEEQEAINVIRQHLKDKSDLTWGAGRGNIYNVGCMLPYMDYTPRTLEEIMEKGEECLVVKEEGANRAQFL